MSGAGKRPEIERGPLRDLLLDSLEPGTVQWDRKLESAEMQNQQVLLRFSGGTIALADIAIGSDGANSRMRGAFEQFAAIERDLEPTGTAVNEVCFSD